MWDLLLIWELSWASLCAFSFAAFHLLHCFLDSEYDGVSTKSQVPALQQRIYEMVSSRPGARFSSSVQSACVVFLVSVQWTFVELSSHPDSYCSCEPSFSKALFFSKRKHPSLALCHDSYYHVPRNVCHLARTSFVQVVSVIPRTLLLKCWIEIQCKPYI